MGNLVNGKKWDGESEKIVRKLQLKLWDGNLFNPLEKKNILYSEEFTSKNRERQREILDRSQILPWSARWGALDLVRMIIQLGGNPNVHDEAGRTALFWASFSGNASLLSCLVKNGGDVNKIDKYGKTVIMWSHRYGNPHTSILLLQLGANIEDIKDQLILKDKHGWTFLHRAVEEGDEKIVKWILSQNSCLLTTLNSDLQTAFLLAKDLNQEDIANLIKTKETRETFEEAFLDILRRHCVQSRKCCIGLGVLVRELEISSQSLKNDCLYQSQFYGHYDTSVLLIQQGANIDKIKDRINDKDAKGWTLLHRAVVAGDRVVVELIVSQDNVNVSILNQELKTAFLLARDLKQERIANLIEVKETRESFEDIFFDILKRNCLLSKTCCGGLKILLCKLGSKNIIDDKTKLSALALAAKNGHSELLQEILGNNPHWKDENYPPLIWQASNANQLEAIQVLLHYENTVQKWNVKAQDGTNSLTVALLKQHIGIVDSIMNCDRIKYDNAAQEACTQFGQFQKILELSVNTFNHCKLALKCNEFISAKALYGQLSSKQKLAIQNQSDDIHSVRMRTILDLSVEQRTSDFIKLTKKYPIINEKIEENKVLLDTFFDGLGISRMKESMMEEFCCIAAHKNEMENKDGVVWIENINTAISCVESCIKQKECKSVADMVRLCQLLEQNMNQENEMSKLKPKMVLTGSIAEGTRMGKATEMDVALQFGGLEEFPFSLTENATEVISSPDGPLKKISPNGIFSFSRFLWWFLQTIHECLFSIRKNEIPKSIRLFPEDFDPDSCQQCIGTRKSDSIYSPYSHCMEHLASVKTRKVGGCLVFEWNGRVQSIDITPIFPIESKGIFHLFDKVTKTLVCYQYPNWLTYLQTLRITDVILPEALGTIEEKEGISYCALKILHFGPENNYIIKPAQEIKIANYFEKPRLKDVYKCIKAIKSRFDIPVKSYFIKKTLILPDFLQKIEDESVEFPQLLFDALSHPELKRFFVTTIDFEIWQRKLMEEKGFNNHIPIGWKQIDSLSG